VQEQGQVIEAHHLMEQAGQLVERRSQLPVRGDCLSVKMSAGHGETPWFVLSLAALAANPSSRPLYF